MSALLILNYDVHDTARLQAYRRAATPVLAAADAVLMASTDATVHLAEAEPGGSHTVVLWFADVETALAAYHSADYQSLLAERVAATTPRSAVVVPTLG